MNTLKVKTKVVSKLRIGRLKSDINNAFEALTIDFYCTILWSFKLHYYQGTEQGYEGGQGQIAGEILVDWDFDNFSWEPPCFIKSSLFLLSIQLHFDPTWYSETIWSYIDLQVKVNGEVSQDTGETHLGTLSLAAMETSGLNTLDDKEEGVMHMEMEMEEVRRPGSSDCQGQELEGRDFQEEEIVRQEVPVIDVTTPSQDGSCEKLLWKFLAQTLLLFVVM